MSALEWRESFPRCLVHLEWLPSDLGLGNWSMVICVPLLTRWLGYRAVDMVRDGRVRELDRTGNDLADQAADFGRRRVEEGGLQMPRRSLPVPAGIGTRSYAIFIGS